MAKRKPGRPDTAATPAAIQPPREWLFYAAALAAAIVVGLVVYSPAAGGPFLLDDRYQYFGRPDAGSFGLPIWIAGGRPLLNATFWLNYQISGTEPGSYHTLNVLLHACNAALVLLITRALWRTMAGERASQWPPVIAAALFLLHPLQTESVAYISSRSETLSILFAYGALALQLTAPAGRLGLGRIAAMLGALALAVLTKEHAAALPAVFLLTDYFWRGGWPAIKENWRLHGAMVVAGVAGLAFVGRTLAASTSAGFGIQDLTPIAYLATQLRMFWRYARMLVLPVGQNVDPDIANSAGLGDPAALAGLAALAALVGAAWWLRERAPLATYGILVFGILLAPTSSFIPILDVFAEHRVYLPMLGFCCLVLAAFRQWRTPTAAAALVLALFAYATFARSAVWSSEEALWANAVAGSPAKYRPRFQLAYARYQGGQCAEAANTFAAAEPLAKSPDVTLYVDWALALDCAGKQAEALTKLTRAAAIEDSAHVRSLAGMMHAKLSNLPQALDSLDRAEALDPKFAMTYVYRGNIYVLQNRREEARAQFRHALELEPANTAAAQGLAAAR